MEMVENVVEETTQVEPRNVEELVTAIREGGSITAEETTVLKEHLKVLRNSEAAQRIADRVAAKEAEKLAKQEAKAAALKAKIETSDSKQELAPMPDSDEGGINMSID